MLTHYPQEHELDLALAAELQAALLPDRCPTDCVHQVAATRNRMCGSVGGDFFDFIRLNQDQYAIVIGDVVGHGVQAALLMAKISGFLHTDLAVRARPSDTIKALNRMLISLGERVNSVLSCSIVYAVIDAPSGVGFFINAGHPRPFICDRNACSTLHIGPHNLLLGIEDFEPKEACHTFVPGQRMVLYTDGVTDAMNDQMERFGDQRLHEIISTHAENSAEQCADAIFAAIDSYRNGEAQTDDETVVVIDRV